MTELPNIGGDPESIRAVASWFRDHVAPAVEEADAAVDRIQKTASADWDDDAARSFVDQLRAGGRKMDAFADSVRQRAKKLDEFADALARAEAKVEYAKSLAKSVDLRVEDGWIHAPHPWEEQDGQPENMTDAARQQWYAARSDVYEQVRDEIASGYELIRLKIVGDSSYDWGQLVFKAGDLVKEELQVLVEHQSKGVAAGPNYAGPLAELADDTRKRTPFRPPPPRVDGISNAVFKLGGWALTVNGAAYSISQGDSMDKVVLTTGVGIATQSSVAWIIRVGFGPPGWFVALSSFLAGAIVSDVTGAAYDRLTPARDRLLGVASDLDPGRRRLPGN